LGLFKVEVTPSPKFHRILSATRRDSSENETSEFKQPCSVENEKSIGYPTFIIPSKTAVSRQNVFWSSAMIVIV